MSGMMSILLPISARFLLSSWLHASLYLVPPLTHYCCCLMRGHPCIRYPFSAASYSSIRLSASCTLHLQTFSWLVNDVDGMSCTSIHLNIADFLPFDASTIWM